MTKIMTNIDYSKLLGEEEQEDDREETIRSILDKQQKIKEQEIEIDNLKRTKNRE